MAANTITRGRLRRLAELRPEHGLVLSVFFNLDPSEFATPAARSTEINSVVTAAAKKVDEAEGLDHDARQALRADVNRVREVLTGSDVATNGTHGLAIFACGPADVLEVVRLPHPIESRAIVDDHACVEPLIRRFKRRPFDHLVVGAPEELVAEVEERLHPYLRQRLAGRVGIDVENSSADDVQSAAAEGVDRPVAQVERDALDRMQQ